MTKPLTKQVIARKILRLMRNHQVDKLAPTLEPRKTVNQDREIVGTLPISQLSRIAPLISDTNGTLTLSVIVSFEDNKLYMRGNVNATLDMQCQRCLLPMSVDVESDFECVIVKDEDASKALPAHIDGYVCEDKINLHDLAEEELLLAIPMSPKHDDCDAGFSNESLEPATHTPFAGLKDLIKPN